MYTLLPHWHSRNTPSPTTKAPVSDHQSPSVRPPEPQKPQTFVDELVGSTVTSAVAHVNGGSDSNFVLELDFSNGSKLLALASMEHPHIESDKIQATQNYVQDLLNV